MQKLILLSSLIFFQSLLIAQSPGDSMMVGDVPDPEQIQAQDPTYKNFPTPDEVLVVYADSTLGDSSRIVAEYYASIRNIPNENLMPGLTIPPSITYPEGTVTVEQSGEDIRGADTLCWRYVKDVIADTIQNYLNNTYVNGVPLADRINYIVLVKGIPFKVRNLPYNDSTWAIRRKTHMSVGALLCLLNQPDPNKNFMQLYGTSISSQLSPLFQVDPNITMDYRFVSNHFVNNGGWYTQYLTSWLIGDTYADAIDLIDRLADPDYSGEKTWVIDDDPDPWYHHFTAVHSKLTQLEFYLNPETYVNSQDWIITDSNNVMGYVSHGVHAGMPANYILEELEFDYTHGANFLSWESFNAYSFGVLTSSQVGQGLISDFIHREGSGGSGHVYEPWTDGVTYEDRTYPSYAMGYTLVDAQYHGIYYDAWRNMVIGDPLTAIAWGKQTLTQNLTWTDRNLVTGEITIPLYKTLTIEDDSYIELRHQGFIPCNPSMGRMYIGQNVTFETDDWQRSLFLSYGSQYARIIWADHLTFPAISYNVYRKIGEEGNWNLIANTMENEYTDTQVQLTCYECAINAVVYYKVTAVSQLQESDYSNEVSAEVITKVHKNMAEDQVNEKVYNYSLSQNYPNPFNPTTKISYSIKETGLVELKVYDILGTQVASLVNENQSAGKYEVNFNASNLPSGIYFYKLTSGSFTETKKLLLLK